MDEQHDIATDEDEKSLLLSLAYGALHETEPVGGAEFAARLAVCARLTQGDQEAYSRAVKRAVVQEIGLTELFPGTDTEAVLRSYLRVIRHARGDNEILTWLGQQFETPQPPEVMKEYLVAVERALANSFISRR